MKGLPEWNEMHHAYLIAGGFHVEVWNFLEAERNFKRQANPDALAWELETFGIDEARDLSEWAIKKPFGERKVAVVSALSITSEAQNALLKLFEEPTLGTYFFLTLNNLGSMLPTLLSRVQVINIDGKIEKREDGKIFLKSDVPKRLKMIQPIIKEKNKEAAQALVSEIERYIPATHSQTVLEAQRFLASRGSSPKMILEHLAVSLPVI